MITLTEMLGADEAGIARAAALLRGGGTVAFPTETVYGLGADATNGDAAAKIYEAKGRPSFNPLIVHVTDLAAAQRLIALPEAGLRLAKTCWPGPLTLVAPMQPDCAIASLVSAGLPTLAVRVPDHPLTQALLQACDVPVAAPSANPSGKISPTLASHVADGLDGHIDAVLDGGAAEIGLESTIIGFDGDLPVLLRPGGVPLDVLEDAAGTTITMQPGTDITAPGQLPSHYAPDAPLRLNAKDARPDELRLGFGPGACDLNLSEAGSLREAASNLFAHLHSLDARAEGRTIAVAPIPEDRLGHAINDRLARAAAPR